MRAYKEIAKKLEGEQDILEIEDILVKQRKELNSLSRHYKKFEI